MSFYDNISARPVYLIIFLAILFLFNIGKRDLWEPGEPRYAMVSQEMRESGDLLLPHLNGEKYPDKPPVLFWLINIFSVPFGCVTALSARLPSAFSGIGCALLTYYMCREMFSGLHHAALSPHRIGFLAALILSTSIEYTIAARRVSFDVLLTLIITASLLCFYKWYAGRRGGKTYLLLSYLFMSIATITKGPVGFVIPILVIAAFQITVRLSNRQAMTNGNVGQPGVNGMYIGRGVLILLSIPLLWVACIYLQGGWGHTREVVFDQNIGRVVNSWSHKQPIYYFVVNFPLHFLPWSIFIPSAIIFFTGGRIARIAGGGGAASACGIDGGNLVQYNTGADARNSAADLRRRLLLPFVWIVVILAFFSLVSGKKSTYILPAYPAASIFIALFLNVFIYDSANSAVRRLGYIPLYVTTLLLIIVGFGFGGWVYYYHNGCFRAVLPSVIIFICGVVVVGMYLMRGDPFKSLSSSFVLFLVTVILGSQFVIPYFNEKKSARRFAGTASGIVGAGGKLASYRFFRSAYLYYAGWRRIDVIMDMEGVNEFIRDEDQVFLLMREGSFREISGIVDSALYVLLRGTVGHRTMVLVSNRPAEDDRMQWGLPQRDHSE